ncbi:hypothetical protein [Thiobacillus sp. 65-1402]|uniref:hypothetical protein n=1 Tax=Thiobacillus sp. 65-1402 TaxID=1895861 RepID=UPI0009610E2A|nr:hypothetical protein [Thiobacillus sp. 65-1402]OJW81601.1 MAG: hypothetical protein BGO62_15495 [Thiobacillus sp. 65-1402]
MFAWIKTAYQKTRAGVQKVKAGAQTLAVAGSVALASLFNPAPAEAAVDGAVSAGITALEADAATLGGLATGAVVSIMLIILGIRLVKKMLGRAV